MEDGDAVWAETSDGGLLRQLFGFYPTLHEALVRSVAYSRAADRLEMVIDYQDDSPGDRPLKARISLLWSGVASAKLSLGEGFISAARFRRSGPLLVTEFSTLDGFEGEVAAETFEAKLVSLDPDPGDARPPISWTLE